LQNHKEKISKKTVEDENPTLIYHQEHRSVLKTVDKVSGNILTHKLMCVQIIFHESELQINGNPCANATKMKKKSVLPNLVHG
jgi:hypothetical protein